EIQIFGEDGFFNFLHKVLSTMRGVNCTIKETLEVMIATTKYIDAIDACGTEVPKDVAKIVKNCMEIIKICDEIIHLNSQLCSSDDEDAKTTSATCFVKLLSATIKLTRKLHDTLILMCKLPGDTEVCFVDATKEVENSYNNFLPKINDCCNEY
ncbi:hypothetical protein KR044_001134, partial [Drosophila immigrans]